MSDRKNNESNQAIIDHRQRLVATLRLRRLTQREIVDALEKQRFLNPKTRKPWSLQTINNDLKALSAEWQAEAAKTTAEHKANMLAELEEVRRAAWGTKDYTAILKALKQTADLFGLDAPRRQEVSGPEGGPIETRDTAPDFSKLTDDELRDYIGINKKLRGDDSD